MNFGEQLKSYRKKKNLTQKQLAEMLDISRNYLSEVERSKKNASDELREKASSLFKKEKSEPQKNVEFLTNKQDLKMMYKKRVISDMKSLNTYKIEFEQIIDIYTDLLVQYRNALDQYKKEKEHLDIYMNETGKKPALVLIIENLRKDIITYSDRLTLNPKSIQNVISDSKPKSKLAEALKAFGQ
ncbi:hypothetical protein HMI01_15070 [Halolactibacillus miurensis]|uniref:Phage terminase, small subunit n=1 Tax=Halolactibacillus miurensis TaxID=306541 RepID=A0A1I6S051_9BACI|nr:helix-turn-helix domain-containing protein [Halolactibacillus miurensis]GEM04519.1 hypothetical protein HMI01_15070 [Halolactibacillus miurensis]SFS70220.1 Phage terminase, small subunit [Halolactibacillus miurensis]